MKENRRPHPERVAEISRLLKPGMTAAVCIDDISGQPELYKGLMKQYPNIEVLDEGRGPTPGVYTIRVRGKSNDPGASTEHKGPSS